MTQEKSVYRTLSQINVNDKTRKKGQFTYLSWAWAVDQLLLNYPDATWDVHEYEHAQYGTLPYMQGPNGAFVKTSVTINGITRSLPHPVLNHKNQAIQNPDPFAVNTAIQRCLAKNIAMHGLGLYIYAGEDLPPDPKDPITTIQKEAIEKAVGEFAQMRNRTSAEVYGAMKISKLDGLTEAEADRALHVVNTWLKKAREEDKQAEKLSKTMEG